MKKLTLLLLLITSSLVKAQTTLIPDPAFEQVLINQGYDIGPINGSVPTANIDTVTHLVANFGSISDLTGIEDFTNLRFLECFINQLTSLNLTNNDSLTTLWCGDNQLDSLDVSQNLLLRDIDCKNNSLDSIDVSSNTLLETFRCGNNQLTTLNITQNTLLEYLECHVNLLTNIDVTQNLALTSFTIFVNQLTTLDVTFNTNLEALVCYGNQISNIDFTQNSQLKILDCGANNLSVLDVTQNPLLETLRCRANSLTQLDVTQNLLLYVIEFQGNMISTLDLSLHSALISLNCSNNSLTCLNIKNGTNINLSINSLGNPQLSCIDVDSVAYSTIWWLNVDTWTSFSTNCGNLCSTVGIVEQLLHNVNIYPNPTSGQINISLKVVTDISVTIRNNLGQIILAEKHPSSDKLELDISEYPTGIYFLQLEVDGEIITKKIIKE